MSNQDIDLVLAKRIVNFMNELLQLDRNAIVNLINTRMVCNKELAEHPTVQVTGQGDDVVGILGVLNGLCGIYDNGFGAIAVVTDNIKGIQKFSVIVPDKDTGDMKEIVL